MTGAHFCQLTDTGLIAFEGEDAVPFLHAQVTSDVAGLASPATQYSGYCSPKGRLLATFLLWRRGAEILLQLPLALRETIQARLAKYVLRSRVKVSDATARHALFGIGGDHARALAAALAPAVPERDHAVVSMGGLDVTRLPVDRYLVLAPAEHAEAIRARLLQSAHAQDHAYWQGLDVEAGVPVITAASQDEYVPQMVNLDLVGGVSYTKGCYPGQEIVARMHYLGRLKQRMYRVRAAAVTPLDAGDPLYSPAFGADQASGAVLYASPDAREALAVIQTAAVQAGPVRVGAPGGPALEILTLPYALPA